MLADEAASQLSEPAGYPADNFGLTIPAADLFWKGNDHSTSQGYFDYEAHAHVYQGGADPLGSRGYASAVSHPSSSSMRPAKPKARGRFCLWADFLGMVADRQ
jgi:hypothetical protein